MSHYEFSRVRDFVGQLAASLPVGPQAVRASLVHVGSQPHTEFPFDQHGSGAAVRDGVLAAAQRMGDTRTGLALAYAKEQLFSEAAGARPGVSKALVWVTDGFSSDPVGPPMRELKDLGVTVFIISTGRGNRLELLEAASAPSDSHLHFVDVDDLPIITQRLQGAILGRGAPTPGAQGSPCILQPRAATAQSTPRLLGSSVGSTLGTIRHSLSFRDHRGAQGLMGRTEPAICLPA